MLKIILRDYKNEGTVCTCLRNTIDDYVFEIIERDKFSNPVAILVIGKAKWKAQRNSQINNRLFG